VEEALALMAFKYKNLVLDSGFNSSGPRDPELCRDDFTLLERRSKRVLE
jgi:hypothetical protein